MTELKDLSPRDFCDFLLQRGVTSFCLYWDEDAGRVRATCDALQELADFVNADERDFDRHEGLFVQLGPETGTLQGAFVHRTCRGQAAGGVRFWSYDTVEDFLRDGMRLARGMTYKNALAGLWWGGGKGVMARGTGLDASEPSARRRWRTWLLSSRAHASRPAFPQSSGAAGTPRFRRRGASCAAWRPDWHTSGWEPSQARA